jgi:hypothetical protein
VKPLHKKGIKPMSQIIDLLLWQQFFSKVVEKVMNETLYNYLEKYNLLAAEQKGFRRNKSINMAIYDLIHSIIKNIDNRNHICAIFMDMTRAFDYVDHSILLKKLNAYGIRGNVLDLMKSYLSGREQYTELSQICMSSKCVKAYRSEKRQIKYGVPQGSVLGLYCFYSTLMTFPDMSNILWFYSLMTALL